MEHLFTGLNFTETMLTFNDQPMQAFGPMGQLQPITPTCSLFKNKLLVDLMELVHEKRNYNFDASPFGFETRCTKQKTSCNKLQPID
jgi:hypothetical protein